MNDSRNLILALGLSIAILFGYNYFFASTPAPQQPQTQQQQQSVPTATPAEANAPSISTPTYESKAEYHKALEAKTIRIDTPYLNGTISEQGAAFNDLVFKKYRTTVKENAPNVDLFYPQGTSQPYYASFGWLSDDTALSMPSKDTVWKANTQTLSSESPVTLTYDNGQGLVFERTITASDTYLFQVAERVINKSDKPVHLYQYSMITQGGKNLKGSDYMAYYVGPIGIINDTLKEVSYEDLDSNAKQESVSTGGWIGFTDRYWLSALIPDQQTPYSYEFRATPNPTQATSKFYQTIAKGPRLTIEPGQSHTLTTNMYAGAKQINLLDAYETSLNTPKLDRAIDFGWFYIITKPLLYTLDFLHQYISNMGICIIVLTLLVKLLFYPLANKSYRSMARMKTLQPKIKALQDRFKDDKMKLNQEMMELYKKEKVNPVSGCLPMIIQIPVFFGLYKVLFISIDMRHAPFFGWIHDLSAPDPTTVFNLLGLIPWTPPSFLMLGIWPIILGASMYLQQRMSPQPADPAQAKVMMFLPIMFTFLFANFPVGLVIYWTCNNVLSIAQQWMITKQAEKKVAREKAAKLEKAPQKVVNAKPKKRKK